MQKKQMILTGFILALLATALVLVLRFGTRHRQGPPTIRLSVAAFQDTLLPNVGTAKGWYAAEGLNVEIKLLPWYSVQEALASGSIDVGVSNIASVIGSHQNFPQNIYWYGFNTFDNGFAVMIRPNGSLRTVETFERQLHDHRAAVSAAVRQLKGKTVVTTSRTDMEQVVAYALRSAGMNFKTDIKIVDMDPDEGLAAFLGGTGDAYVGGIPQRTRALKEGYLEMITGSDLGPPEINGLTTTRRFADAHQDELLKLLHVIFRIIQSIDTDPADGGTTIIDELNRNTAAKFTLDDFKRFWNHYEHYAANPAEAQQMILDPQGNAYWKARWDDTNFYFTEVTHTIPRPVDPSDAFWMGKVQRAYIEKYGNK